MAIIKSIKTTDYAQIHNSALQNPNLTMKAKGLLACILSLPEDWIIYKKTLPNFFADSKHAINSAFNELEKHRYAIHVVGHNEKGHKVHTYFIRDIPFDDYEFEKYNNLYSGLVINDDPAENQEISGESNTQKTESRKSDFGKSDTTKEIYKQKNIKKDDDDIPNTSLSVEINNSSSKLIKQNKEKIHTPSLSDDDLLWITEKVRDIFKGKIQKRSFDSVARKCINNYKNGTVPYYENYLISAIERKIEELELRKEKEKTLLSLVPKTKKHNRKESVPSWLKEEINSEQDSKTEEPTKLEAERKRLEAVLKKYKRD